MKKVVGLLLSLFVSATSYTQIKSAVGLRFNPAITGCYSCGEWILNKFAPNSELVVKQNVFRNMLYLESGIGYINKGYAVDFISSTGINVDKKSYDYSYFISVPLALSFNYKGFYGSSGINLNFHSSRKLILHGQVISTQKPDFFDYPQVGIQFSTGYQFKLAKKLYMDANVFYNRWQTYPLHTYAIGIGIHYAFRIKKEEDYDYYSP